jgi:hypothetical protein
MIDWVSGWLGPEAIIWRPGVPGLCLRHCIISKCIDCSLRYGRCGLVWLYDV